ncbi:transmembrane protein 45B-like [Macrobrachium nipponense]|uniref:transmembrane protein 45B-like n=1 Tax=Macrobrachium nipponense TaxID=159736 RepID=UPI0030C8A2B8
MGSFIGHVVPGTFFALFGMWFTYQTFMRYFMCQRVAASSTMSEKYRMRYRNTSSFKCPCCASLPLEGVLKVVATVVGMAGEFATGFEGGKFTHIGNAQHMTMFFFFGLNGVVDIIQHYRVPIPPDMDFISGVLAFSMEALLFYYHLHGRTPMDIQVHMLLFYVVVSCAVCVALEMCYKGNVLPALGKAYFVLLQGTWFYQIGFLLYPPIGEQWDQNEHSQMMMVTLFFTWHNATIFTLMSIAGSLIYLRVKSLSYAEIYEHLQPRLPRLAKLDEEQAKNIMLESDEGEA